MQITTYNLETGEFGAVRSGATLELLTRHLREGQGYKEGAWPPALYRVDLETGEVVERAD